MKIFFRFFAFCLFFIGFKAFADDAGIQPPSLDELAALVAALGGVKGASTLAVVALVVQGLMLLLRSKLGEVAGKYRLLAVYLLTVVGTVVGFRIAGLDLGAALVHAQTLTAAQVLVNQVFKQFFQKSS